MSANISELIYDWNTIYARAMVPAGRVLLNDESLRDGLQSPSVRDPSIEEKIEILHLMEAIGINMLDIGLPGAGPRAVAHCEALAREIGRAKLKIKPNCAARTHQNDIRPVAEIVERTGVPIEVATFIGSSPIRRYTEDWSDDFLLRTTENAVKYAVVARPRRDVRDRGHHALRSRDHQAAVQRRRSATARRPSSSATPAVTRRRWAWSRSCTSSSTKW